MLKMFISLITTMDYIRRTHTKIWISIIAIRRVICSIELLLSLLLWNSIYGCLLFIDGFGGLLVAEVLFDNVENLANNIQKLKDEGSL